MTRPSVSPSISSLVDLLKYHADEMPDHTLYTFLESDDLPSPSLTYRELDHRARQIASDLKIKVSPGERALLLYPPGLDYIAAFFGCLYAGVIAVPAYPPDPYRLSRTLPRLQSILQDSGAKWVLTTESIHQTARLIFSGTPSLKNLNWETTDHLKDEKKEWQCPPISSAHLAFLQYTSGSTGQPKGVMLSHANLLHNLGLIYRAFDLHPKSRGVSWLPPYHDMGLIGGILEPLFGGGFSVLMSPLTFLQKPFLWLKAISDFRATTSGGPNFAYELCLRKITPEQIGQLNLSSWNLAFCGAEPVRAETLRQFQKVFAPCGFKPEAFYPCYGLAEATLMVSGGNATQPPVFKRVLRDLLKEGRVSPANKERKESEKGRSIEVQRTDVSHSSDLSDLPSGEKILVGCGNSFQDQEVLIVHPETCLPCEPGEIGEIWVSGPSIAQGYWGKKQLTREVFRAVINPSSNYKNDRTYLRTGDLGFLDQGELFITDRLKDLIILNGQNHYPHDLEETLEKAHPALRPGAGAAFSVDEDGEEFLILVQELSKLELSSALSYERIFSAIREQVAKIHEVDIHAIVLIRPGTLPKTSSGKVSRRFCREDFLNKKMEIVAQWKKDLPSKIFPFKNQDAILEVKKTDSDHTANSGQTYFSKPLPQQILNWLINAVSSRAGVSANDLDPQESFAHYGLDSKELVGLSGDLEIWLGRKLSPTLLWEYPNMKALAEYLGNPEFSDLAIMGSHASLNSEETPRIDKKENQQRDLDEPIAVIGMACRFPGAENLEAFWKLLESGKDAITPVPADRWKEEDYYDPRPGEAGKMNTRWGGFITRPDFFDASFFKISPREATRMDPQQRLLLEVSWEAFESAALNPSTLQKSKTGVFVGISSSDYAHLQWEDPSKIDAYAGVGNAHSIAANRLSYFFDFQGPSLAVDTACSSSLVAVHMACESLRRMESNLALAGGVNLILRPELNIAFSQARMMSPEGRCKTFDEKADGYVRGEGCGVVILKRLAEAVRDKDEILGIIRGSAVNQDGRSNGLTAPNGQAQQDVILQALQRAKISSEKIDYVEAHGTGTPLGDPIEMAALGKVLQKNRPSDSPCKVGSVKTNFGHLEAAAGIAGLIKVLLSLKHRQIPSHLHFKKINPHIDLTALKLSIPTQMMSWNFQNRQRFAGISSFGFGGTNAHVVVGGPEEIWINKENEARQKDSLPTELKDADLYPFKLSAKSVEGLKTLAERWISYLQNNSYLSLKEVCFTACAGRADFEHRSLFLPCSLDELKKNLSDFVLSFLENKEGFSKESSIHFSVSQKKKPRIAFLFTGQGSQYVGMGCSLYESEPCFRKVLDRCDGILKPVLETSLLSILFDSKMNPALIHETLYTQPALFALEYALYELWKSWGIEPDFVLGHSVGEYVAACVAKVMEWEEGLTLIAHRAKLMHGLPKNGTMLAVIATEEQIESSLKPYAHEVSIAAFNGPRALVLSGKREAIEALQDEFTTLEIATQTLNVSHAFHSPLMDPILDAFEEKAKEISFYKPQIPLISNRTGNLLETAPTATYWRKHLREPVRYFTGIETLIREGADALIEIGPQPILTLLAKRGLAKTGTTRLWLSSLKNEGEDRDQMLKSLSALYQHGLWVNWKAVFGQTIPPLPLAPTYPFARESYWFGEWGKAPSSALLPIQRKKSESVFEHRIDLKTFPYLLDHRVQKEILFPATASLAYLYEAGKKQNAQDSIVLKKISFQKPLFLDEGKQKTLILRSTSSLSYKSEFEIYSQEDSDQTLQACAEIAYERNKPESKDETLSLHFIRERVCESVGVQDFYQKLKWAGLEYGPSFQGIQKLFKNNREALGFIESPKNLKAESPEQSAPFHPALLDACLQVVAAALPESSSIENLYLPVRIDEIFLKKDLGSTVWSYAKIKSDTFLDEKIVADIFLFDVEGKTLGIISGLHLTGLGKISKASQSSNENLIFEQEWEIDETPLPMEVKVIESWLVLTANEASPLAKELREKGQSVLTKSWKSFQDEIQNESSESDAKNLFHVGQSECQHLLIEMDSLCDPLSFEGISEAEKICGDFLAFLKTLLQADLPSYPKLTVVTQGAQAHPFDPENPGVSATALWGMLRSVQLEHPELSLCLIDLPSHPTSSEITLLTQTLMRPTHEDEFLIRENRRWVCRLKIASETPAKTPQQNKSIQDFDAYRLEIVQSGSLDGMGFRPVVRRAPGDHEVEIVVRAAGLNFSDVLKALGLYPGARETTVPLGAECSGKIVRLGERVKGFKVGDEVIAIAPYSFGNFVTTAAPLVVLKPAHLNFEEAASVPVAFLTATHALHDLGRMRKKEKILIHAGAGGVGLAAVQLAQQTGLEIFATAGSDEKRAYLKSLGVEHVFDSRTTKFAEEILTLTQDRGVDLVLNSLPGEFISKSLQTLAPFGRFLEIGKSDIYQNHALGLLPFQKSLSYFAIDLDRIFRERQDLTHRLFTELISQFEHQHLKPIPHTTFPISDAPYAFRFMAQRKNTGKIVLTFNERPKTFAAKPHEFSFSRDASYLITGGLGGLGFELARWMISKGARHLFLVSRKSPTEHQLQEMVRWKNEGAHVLVHSADLSKRSEVDSLLDVLQKNLPPLRGIFHLAGVLKDGVLLHQTKENFQSVFTSKAMGAFYLHEATRSIPLDYFILFSSLSGTMGSYAQSNYSAANAFLNGLAHARNREGLVSQSIVWGPWAKVGMATHEKTVERMQAWGIHPLSLDQGFGVLEKLLLDPPGFSTRNPIVVSWDQKKLQENLPESRRLWLKKLESPETTQNRVPSSLAPQDLYEIYLKKPPEKRREWLLSVISEKLARVLGSTSESLKPGQSLNHLGLDSLMAIELKNEIEQGLQTKLPIALLLKGPTISELADQLVQQMEEKK